LVRPGDGGKPAGRLYPSNAPLSESGPRGRTPMGAESETDGILDGGLESIAEGFALSQLTPAAVRSPSAAPSVPPAGATPEVRRWGVARILICVLGRPLAGTVTGAATSSANVLDGVVGEDFGIAGGGGGGGKGRVIGSGGEGRTPGAWGNRWVVSAAWAVGGWTTAAAAVWERVDSSKVLDSGLYSTPLGWGRGCAGRIRGATGPSAAWE
jgi:hypothetical protein